ncbi:MAG: pyruvate kinase [Acidimicrobiia bacterium]|nr:pyruvate kinase [Acidimicrobiia bacterium]
MRQTKIIATVGPASNSDAGLDALIAAGTDVVRLNFSHGTHETHGATYARVRAAAARAGRTVAILQDLGGPKIRTGRLQDGKALELAVGDTLTIATGDFVGGPGRVSTNFEGLARGVQRGGTLLLADGTIELRVESTDGSTIIATVTEGGVLGEHKGINAPGVELAAGALTAKDIDDLRFGLALGVDLVALSFVRGAADLRHARQLMTMEGAGDVPLVAKLERPEAIQHLSEILTNCQAVMVARGDLGLEMPLVRVPRVQKDIIRRARLRGIPTIVATQVLESMTKEARPTRAEVSDAANAVGEGVDGIMLAAETATGAHPTRAVQTLDAIIREAELSPPDEASIVVRRLADDHDHVRALCAAAVTLANRGDARAIIAVTQHGSTARQLSALRPRAPILAVTASPQTTRRIALHWGVVPVCLAEGDLAAARGSRSAQPLVALGYLSAGDTAVFININPDLGLPDANYLRIQRL